MAFFLCLIFILGFMNARISLKGYTKAGEYYSRFLNENLLITVQGEIYKKEFKNERYRLYLKNVLADTGKLLPGRVLLYSDSECNLGDVLVVCGKMLEPGEAENEGGFDYSKYLKSQKIYGLISATDIKNVESSKLPIREYLYRLKEKMTKFYRDNMDGEEAGMLSAMVWGDKTEMDMEAAELFRKAGLSHILAISGLHLAILGLGLYTFLRKIRLSFLQAGVFSTIVVYFYAIITGAPISFIRAVGMLFLSLLANILGKSYDMLSALSLVAFCMLLYNPFFVYNPGFVMSFTAVLGICFVAIPIGGYYNELSYIGWTYKNKGNFVEKYKMSPLERIVSTLLSGTGLVVFTYPVVAYYYNEIPVYVVFLNLIILPFMGLLLISGLIGGLLFIKSSLYISHLILFFYEWACDIFTRFPGALITIPKPTKAILVIYYLNLIICVAIITNHKKILLLEKRFKVGKEIKMISHQIRKMLVSFIFLSIVSVSLLFPSWHREFRIDMLSVGQGDGIYIRSKEGVNFFIDGGSTSIEKIGKEVIKPYFNAMGIRKIDYWIISHLDTDHISGFMELLAEGYRIDNVIMSKYVVKSDDYLEIKELCKDNKTKLVLVENGDRIATNSMYMEAIFPDGSVEENDANANSLCMYLSYGDFQAIFTGDISSKEENIIIKSKFYKNIINKENIELINAAHHGSKNSNSLEWLEAVMPEAIIISAGKNNRYGHPNKETMERIKQLGIDCYCTVETGRIRLEIDKKGRKKWDFYVPLYDDKIYGPVSH